MTEMECYNCGTRWNLAAAKTNRCPSCGWIQEIYYDRARAERVAKIYNEQQPPLLHPSGVRPLIGAKGFSVSFPKSGSTRRSCRATAGCLTRKPSMEVAFCEGPVLLPWILQNVALHAGYSIRRDAAKCVAEGFDRINDLMNQGISPACTMNAASWIVQVIASHAHLPYVLHKCKWPKVVYQV